MEGAYPRDSIRTIGIEFGNKDVDESWETLHQCHAQDGQGEHVLWLLHQCRLPLSFSVLVLYRDRTQPAICIP